MFYHNLHALSDTFKIAECETNLEFIDPTDFDVQYFAVGKKVTALKLKRLHQSSISMDSLLKS